MFGYVWISADVWAQLRMAWSIELVPQHSSSSHHPVKRTGVSVFSVGECWGFDKFYFVQELERDGLVSQEDKALVFRLTMRCHDYQVCHALSAAHADTLARKVCGDVSVTNCQLVTPHPSLFRLPTPRLHIAKLWLDASCLKRS
jgi:hypothetical protein